MMSSGTFLNTIELRIFRRALFYYHSNHLPMYAKTFFLFSHTVCLLTCMFIQHIVEPVYVLHYNRHVAEELYPEVYTLDGKVSRSKVYHFRGDHLFSEK